MEEKINIEEEEKDNSNNEDNEDNNFETDLLKYNFDYSSKFKTCNISEIQSKKFLLNLFLMSSKINIFDKIIGLNKLYDIYRDEKNFEMLYNITYKLINYLKQQRIPTQYINMSSLFSYDFLNDLENYYYAFKSLNDIKKLTMKENIDNYLYNELKDFVILKIKTYKSIFQNILNEERIRILSEIINKILNENKDKEKNNEIKDNNNNKNEKAISKENKIINNKENKNIDISIRESMIEANHKENNMEKNNENLIEQNEKKIAINNETEIDKMKININKIENDIDIEKDFLISFDNIKEINIKEQKNSFLYVINKRWLENARIFLDNYIFAKESNLLKEFFNESFEPEYAIQAFLMDEKIKSIPKSRMFFPFPGPINNFALTAFKDKWIDPINIEENDLIQKDLVNGKDYILVNYKEWIILQNAFSFTNILITKKDDNDMLKLGVIIFNQRFKKYKNSGINLFKKKIIQISKNAKIYDFIGKILRSVDYEIENIKQKKNKDKKNKEKNNKRKNNNININSNNESNKNKNVININSIEDEIDIKNNNNGESIIEERKVLFYKVNKNNKDIVIEMFICFVNDIQIYESVFIKEIKLNENNKIQDFLKKFNPKKELLIIEILDSCTSPKFLHQIKSSKNKYICSICKKDIMDLNDTKYTCELCSMYLFCSKQCGRNEDTINGKEHHKLHYYLSEIINNKFDLSEFFSRKFYQEIYSNENIKKNKGIVGLINLGNTCYMNCSLQCLSNTKDLTKYFLYNYFQNDINLSNTFGTNGVLLKSYYDLIYKMWLTDFKKLKPNFFRISFCVSTRKFMNNQQQDAMEFISILLNYLHEDLNRVSNKPYILMEEQKENETDIQASKRYWDCHIKRENSIIVDLFHGQFQNIIKCQSCGKEKKSYEPFINISLPIPEEHNFYIIKFFTHLKCKNIAININSNTTFGQLIKKATNYLSKEILDAYKIIKGDSKNDKYCERLLESNIELVKLNKDKIINIIYSQPEKEKEIQENYQLKLLKYIEGGEEIVLFEKKIIPDYLQNIYVYPVMTDIKDIDKVTFLSYPVVFSVKHNLSLRDLEKLIFERFKYILDERKITNNNKNHSIDLHILHSSKSSNTGVFGLMKEYKKCPFCRESYDTKKYCPLFLSFSKDDTVSKIFKFAKNTEPVVLLARSYYYNRNKKVYDDFNFEENNFINKNKNIYDSFNNNFGFYEVLAENDLWNCPKCKQRRRILKGTKIFKPPNYLILQLKRFKKKSESLFNFLESDKNETFVSFPTKNLDLTNYVGGDEKTNAVYNLYAVINHKSAFGFNHFTAFCRNSHRWLEYDDSNVYNCDCPITKDAYILFYIKKDLDE